jgi:protein-tyrosine phosphatase
MPDHALASAPLPAPRHPSGCYRVALVCLGNICRSPTAEVVLRRELAQATCPAGSRSTARHGDWHPGRRWIAARAELSARGYDGSAHRARQFERSWFGDYDLVVAMDRHNLADLRRMAPTETARDRIRLFRSFDPALASDLAAGQRGDSYGGDVPDPYHGSAAEYALAFDLVRQAAARGLAAQLAALIGRPAADGSKRDGAGVTGAAADGAGAPAVRRAAVRRACGVRDGGDGSGGDGSGGDGTAPGHR